MEACCFLFFSSFFSLFFYRGKNLILGLSELGVRNQFTYLLGCILNQGFRIAFTPRGRFCADVDEIPGVVVVFAEDVVFGVVQEGQKLVEEALLALLGELPAEAVHAAPEHGAKVVHVLLRGHPVLSRLMLVALLLIHLALEVCLVVGDSIMVGRSDAPESHAVVVRANYGSQTTHAMRIDDAFHDVEMQFPFIVRGKFLAVAGFDKVHDHIVVLEGFGEREGGLLVLAFVEDADWVVGCGIGRSAGGAGGLRHAGEGLNRDGWSTFLLHSF